MAGEANRRIFFNDRNLDLNAGARIFLGAIPRLRDIAVDTDEPRGVSEFIKQLSLLLDKERIDEGAPMLRYVFIAGT